MLRSKYTRSRDGQQIVSSQQLREIRRISQNRGKDQRRINNSGRRHRKAIDKTNIHWTDKPTRKDIVAQKRKIGHADYGEKKKSGWFW